MKVMLAANIVVDEGGWALCSRRGYDFMMRRGFLNVKWGIDSLKYQLKVRYGKEKGGRDCCVFGCFLSSGEEEGKNTSPFRIRSYKATRCFAFRVDVQEG